MENSSAVLTLIISELNISVTRQSVEDELEKHPDLYSLLALSDVLNNFRVSNDAYQVEFEDIQQVPGPFIAYVSKKEFVLVHSVHSDYVTVSNERWSKHRLSLEEFRKIYSGAVLTAKKDADSGEVDFPKKRRREIIYALRVPMCIVAVCLVAAFILAGRLMSIPTLPLPLLILTLIKTIGIVTSVLLLIQSIDANNPLVQKICRGSSRYNCGAILSSNAAKIFGWLTWSEVGFFYFSGTWLLLVFSAYGKVALSALFILNLASLPYTFYSIYYQAILVKKWCVLCCTVQLLLWLEFISLVSASGQFVFLFGMENMDSTVLAEVFICMVSPVILWTLLKPLFLNTQKLSGLKAQLHRFKYNSDLFRSLLQTRPKYVQPDESWCIVLGDAKAANHITMVSNPFCSACVNVHKQLNELIGENTNIQVRIVFAVSNHESDPKTTVCRHLIALNESNDKRLLVKALHNWYTQERKDYPSWAKNYPVNIGEASRDKINKQKNWCRLVGITATPTLMVNGYRLPDMYRLSDLKYMLQ